MRRRGFFKAIGAILFGGGIANAGKESSAPQRGVRTEVYTWASSDTTPQPKEWDLSDISTYANGGARGGWLSVNDIRRMENGGKPTTRGRGVK